MSGRATVGFKYAGAVNDGLRLINNGSNSQQGNRLKKNSKADTVILEESSKLSAKIRDDLLQKKRDGLLQIVNTAELVNGVEWRVAHNDVSVLDSIQALPLQPCMYLTFKDVHFPAVADKFRNGSIIQLRYSAEKAHVVAESRSNRELCVCAIIFFLSLLVLVFIVGYGLLASDIEVE